MFVKKQKKKQLELGLTEKQILTLGVDRTAQEEDKQLPILLSHAREEDTLVFFGGNIFFLFSFERSDK